METKFINHKCLHMKSLAPAVGRLLRRGPRKAERPGIQGYLAHKKLPPPPGLPQGPRHIRTVGSYGEAVSYGRGTPVLCTFYTSFYTNSGVCARWAAEDGCANPSLPHQPFTVDFLHIVERGGERGGCSANSCCGRGGGRPDLGEGGGCDQGQGTIETRALVLWLRSKCLLLRSHLGKKCETIDPEHARL